MTIDTILKNRSYRNGYLNGFLDCGQEILNRKRANKKGCKRDKLR